MSAGDRLRARWTDVRDGAERVWRRPTVDAGGLPPGGASLPAFPIRDWWTTHRPLAIGLGIAVLAFVLASAAILRDPGTATEPTPARAARLGSFAKLTPDNPFEDHARLQEQRIRQKERELQTLAGRVERLSTELDAVRRTTEEAQALARHAATNPEPEGSTAESSRPARLDLDRLAAQVTSLSADRARAAANAAAENLKTQLGGPASSPAPGGPVPVRRPSPATPPSRSALPGTTGSVPETPASAPPLDRFAGGIRFASNEHVAPAPVPAAPKGPFVLQAGAFARGRVLFGLDAPTNTTHDQAPAIAIQAIDTFQGPNSVSTPLTGCLFLGSARGDFSSSRVVVKITTLSCTFGEVPLEKDITGIVIGPDDKSGVPGELVDHLLETASWATVAGIGQGTADAFREGATTKVVSGVTGNVTSVVDPRKVGQYAVASGASGAAEQIGHLAADRIEKLAPYVSIAGGETVWIYILQGTTLDGLDAWIAATPATKAG